MYSLVAGRRRARLWSAPVLTVLLYGLVGLLQVPRIDAAPYAIGVPALGPGRDVLSRWAPVVDGVMELTGQKIYLVIENEQRELISGLRSRRLDAVLLDPILVHRHIGDIPLQVLATVAVGAPVWLDGENRPQYVLIVPSRSRVFSPAHTVGQPVRVPELHSHPSVAAYTALVFQDAGLSIPSFEYADTQESILKGVSYGQLRVGVVSQALLSDPGMSEFVANTRPIASTHDSPPWVLVARSDGRRDTHEAISNALVGELNSRFAAAGVQFFPFNDVYPHEGVPRLFSDDDAVLLERALHALRILEATAHVPAE